MRMTNPKLKQRERTRNHERTADFRSLMYENQITFPSFMYNQRRQPFPDSS